MREAVDSLPESLRVHICLFFATQLDCSGAYVRWLEEARVRYFLEVGLDYAKLVSEEKTELVVTSLSLRYIKAARMGEVITLRQTLDPARSSRVRIITLSEFVREKPGGDGATELVASAEVAVTPVNVDTGRIARRWPPKFEEAIKSLFEGDSGDTPPLPEWLAP